MLSVFTCGAHMAAWQWRIDLIVNTRRLTLSMLLDSRTAMVFYSCVVKKLSHCFPMLLATCMSVSACLACHGVASVNHFVVRSFADSSFDVQHQPVSNMILLPLHKS